MSSSVQGRNASLVIEALRLEPSGGAFSLSVARGEAVSLMGESQGITSLFCDVLGGFATILSGTITLDGLDITGLPAARRPLALISSRDPVFGHLDVRDNIAFPLRARGDASAQIDATIGRVLALTGLEALGNRRGDTLLPEQSLRLKLARALAYAPSVLVLDNVLAGLDLRDASRTRQLLANLQRALGLTLVYAAQGREDAVWLGGRIALFDQKTLVQCANAPTLLERPSSAMSASLFGEANLLTGRVLDIDNDVARIHLACGGVVEAMADAALSEDSLCIVCVRPDRMTPLFGMASGADDEPPPLTANIQSVLHTGDQIRLRLRLADGAEIEMRRPLLQSNRSIKPGAAMQLAWQASQAVAFPMKDDL